MGKIRRCLNTIIFLFFSLDAGEKCVVVSGCVGLKVPERQGLPGKGAQGQPAIGEVA